MGREGDLSNQENNHNRRGHGKLTDFPMKPFSKRRQHKSGCDDSYTQAGAAMTRPYLKAR
jgi:hypothetical protein